jgi:O-antigen/teichoic acid export membrane protein
LKNLKDLIKTKAFTDFNIVLLDTILSRGCNFLLFILIARTFGPEKYGVYSLITVSISFLVSFFDFGMGNIAVRFSGRYEEERENIFGIYCFCKLAIAVALFILLFTFPKTLPELLNKPQAQEYIFIIFVGFVLDSYQYILVTYYQAVEQFFVRALINIGTFAFRLIAIFILLQFSVDNIEIVALLFSLSSLPVIIIFLNKFINCIRIFISSKIEKDILMETLHYGKWIVLAALPIQLMTRLDFYAVTSFSTFEDMGLYNSAVQLVSFFSYIPFVFGTVFLPKTSKYKKPSEMKSFIKRIVVLGIPITAIILGIIPIFKLLIPFLLGEKYIKSIPIFNVLIYAFIFTLWTTMFGTVFYALGKAKVMTLGAYIQLIFFIIGLSFLTPPYGINGVVWSKVIANAAYFFLVAYILFFHHKGYFKESLC